MVRSRLIAVALAGAFALPLYAAHTGDLAPVGTAAPNFTLPSQDNSPVSLADYKGKWVVLYFYPKDKTSGCTIEAHNFQRDLDKYKALNAVVLGVSLDTPDSHKSFCTDMYGVPVKSFGPVHYAQRDTFLISPDGKVVKEWEVKDVQAHSEEVLAAIQSMK
jgi:peroxiredoxin Q/BCP